MTKSKKNSKILKVIYYDEKITNEKDVLIIKNIIDMVIKIYNNTYEEK